MLEQLLELLDFLLGRLAGWLELPQRLRPSVLATSLNQPVNGVAPSSLVVVHQLRLLASVASFH